MAKLEFDASTVEPIDWAPTEAELQLLEEWRPEMLGQASSLLGRICECDLDILEHVRLYVAWDKEQTQSESDAYKEWLTACKDRKAKIETAKNQWKEAIAERNKLVEAWDTHIADMRKLYHEAKDIPVPERPSK